MPILMWDKPEKVMPKEEWTEIVFDGGPAGGYVPNMSEADKLKWKAKYIGGKHPRVEIRKTTTNGTQILVVVSSNGFPRKGELEAQSDGKNVRISQNGPSFFSIMEFLELGGAVGEALEKLEAMK